jgi:hypothetical protein
LTRRGWHAVGVFIFSIVCAAVAPVLVLVLYQAGVLSATLLLMIVGAGLVCVLVALSYIPAIFSVSYLFAGGLVFTRFLRITAVPVQRVEQLVIETTVSGGRIPTRTRSGRVHTVDGPVFIVEERLASRSRDEFLERLRLLLLSHGRRVLDPGRIAEDDIG